MTTYTLTVDDQLMPAILIGLSAYKGFIREAIERGQSTITLGGITIHRGKGGNLEDVAELRRDLMRQRDSQVVDAMSEG